MNILDKSASCISRREISSRWHIFRCASALTIACTLACGSGSSSEESAQSDEQGAAGPSQCTALREHMIQLRFGDDRSPEGHRVKAATRDQLGDEYLLDCQKRYTIKQVRCAIVQADTTRMEACLRSS